MISATSKRRNPRPAEKTPKQAEKEKRALSMWKEYQKLLSANPLRSKCELRDYLKKKYGYSSNSGFYVALNRGQTQFASDK